MRGIDPGAAVIVDGQETFPGVPIAVGVFSIVFNIFNMIILFPFVSTFERVLSRVGHTSAEDIEDYSVPRYLSASAAADFNTALPAVQQEAQRHLKAGAVFLDIARNKKGAPSDPTEHAAATDALSREIRAFSSRLFQDGLSRDQLDLVASMIEEVDFTSSLSETLFQIARRVKREPFSAAALQVLDQGLEHIDLALNRVLFDPAMQPRMPSGHSTLPPFEDLRWQVLDQSEIHAGEKGALLALLGSIERAENLVQRIVEERSSVDRSGIARVPIAPLAAGRDLPPTGDIVPAE